MRIPIHIAEKLLQLSKGEKIPSGSAKHSLIDELVAEGILEKNGRINKTLKLHDSSSLKTYLHNRYSISDLALYIEASNNENISRSELVSVSSDSKHFQVRTFKGFLVNCYSPLQTALNDKPFTLNPVEGTFQFIYDFEKFIPSADITIVGIENSENFRQIIRQQYLFADIKPLFVSRYPQNQSKDLIKWLQTIPNNYLHFGDFDFSGLNIYINEFKKHLRHKAIFFLPPNIEQLLASKGNRANYDNQTIRFDKAKVEEEDVLILLRLIEKYKRGLEQELLINQYN